MALEVNVKREPESTDDMVALGHLAVSGQSPVTKRLTKKSPIPREARLSFVVGVGVILGLLLIAFVRAHI